MDWDGDGDLDAWVTNRTAPSLRYLRNDSPHTNRSLLLKLEGTTAARDATGARAEVLLKNQPGKPVVRTVKYGEGFLGQSSRWLHFGLGTADIESVTVTWPGGKTQQIKNCRPGTAVAVVEGDPFPQTTLLKDSPPPGPPAPLTPVPPALGAAVTLFHPVLFPGLPSTSPDGKPWTVTDADGPVLVNLFASWCPDCAAELTAWRDAAARIKSAGLSIALLTADGRDTAHATDPAAAWKWLSRNKIPFSSGVLTEEAFRRLTTAHQQMFGAIVNLPIPTSFLLDGKGRLTAVYRGPVSLDRILADTARCRKGDETARQAAALPFPGRWNQPPDAPDPAIWLNDLASHQSWDEAFSFFQSHLPILQIHKDFAVMTGALSEKLAAAGRIAPAITAGEASLTKGESASLLNNLAGLLATSQETSLRDPARAVTLAKKAVSLSGGRVPAILDTLASAQAASGDFKAAATTEGEALSLARDAGDATLLPLLEKNAAAYKAGRLP